jgi:hypothetical protein
MPHGRRGGDWIAGTISISISISISFVSWVFDEIRLLLLNVPHGGTDPFLLFGSDVKYQRHRVLLVVKNAIVAPTKDVLLFSRLPGGSELEERNLDRIGSLSTRKRRKKGAAIP